MMHVLLRSPRNTKHELETVLGQGLVYRGGSFENTVGETRQAVLKLIRIELLGKLHILQKY